MQQQQNRDDGKRQWISLIIGSMPIYFLFVIDLLPLFMKAFVSILLVGFFLFDSLGFYFLFQNQISGARSEAGETMRHERNEWIVLNIPKNAIHEMIWVNAHEFSYGNEMYDLIEQEDAGNEMIFTCYHDKKEGSIISMLTERLKGTADKSSPNSDSTVSLKTFDKYVSDHIVYLSANETFITLNSKHFTRPHSLFYPIVPTPPPIDL